MWGIGALISGLVAALSRLIGTRVGGWVAMALVYLGLGFATKQAVMDPFLSYLQDGFSGLPATVAEWVGYFRIDVYASMVFSAYVAAAAKRIFLRKR